MHPPSPKAQTQQLALSRRRNPVFLKNIRIWPILIQSIDYDPAVGCVTALYWFALSETHFGIMPREICQQFSGFEASVYQASLQPLGYQMYIDPTGKPYSDTIQQLFGSFNHTAESLEAWEKWSALRAEQCSGFILGKSLGDRFVLQPGLNPNYAFFTCYISAYWDDPSAHMD